ncbi:DUF4402 domain-containing protein [Novosphingobium sp. SG720]|uniref:DUF4402 domain-containing protein n=1 Tax=Novosphingobium TaxID=165696 RepID=UPI001445F748|nr:DUF4402 domain-containing protein [Novosphingobium sp. SG720]NKJ44720.1 hypothetical protein [Novosphingobium sp. SG720]
MKKIAVIAAVIAAAAAVPAFAAGNTATTNGTATATVIAPITLAHTSGAALKFGTFTTGAGSITVGAGGAGSVSGGVVFVTGNANAADAFTVTGDPSRSFAITTTGGTIANGTNTIPFTTAASAATGALDSKGNASFTVGGTLTLAGTEPAGAYSGTYSATVTYN